MDFLRVKIFGPPLGDLILSNLGPKCAFLTRINLISTTLVYVN